MNTIVAGSVMEKKEAYQLETVNIWVAKHGVLSKKKNVYFITSSSDTFWIVEILCHKGVIQSLVYY